MSKHIDQIKHWLQRRRLMIGVTAALALGGVVAYASIPDANGVIHGCYKKSVT